MKQKTYVALLLFFSISLISSAILVFNDLKPLPIICDVNEGCFIVKNSDYSKLFFGIPNEYLGLIFFTALIILTLSQMKKPKKTQENLIKLGVLVSFLFGLYSIFIQQFIIHAYCKYCTLMDISIFISVIVLIYFEREKIFSLR